MIRKIMELASIVFMLLFLVLGGICFLEDNFVELFPWLFTWLDSIGMSTGVLIVSTGMSLVLSLALWYLSERQ